MRLLVLLAASFALLAQEVSSQGVDAHLTTLAMAEDEHLREVVGADVDGDGREDLVIATSVKGEAFQRRLRIHLRAEGDTPFGTNPDAVLPVPEDAIAFAVGDVHADPGVEIVLFSGIGIHVLRWRAEEQDRYAKILDADLLWQIPHPRRLRLFPSGLIDVDADGDLDVLVPEPGGYRLALQDVTGDQRSFARGARMRLPREARVVRREGRVRSMRRGGRVRFELDEAILGSGPLLKLESSLPMPSLVDFDGDGDLDLLAQTDRFVHLWPFDASRMTSEFPSIETETKYLSPVEVDADRRLDFFYSARLRELNGDGRVDAVLISGDEKSEDFRSLAQIFLNSQGRGPSAKSLDEPLFGPRGYPNQVLAIGGYLVHPRFDDVDGDGNPDFTLFSLRFDLSDAMSSSGSLGVDLFVFRGSNGRFSRQPDCVRPITIKGETMRGGGGQFESRFFGDITGDGVLELLVRDDADHIQVLWVRMRKNQMEIFEEPIWELDVEEGAGLRYLQPAGQRTELVILEDEQLVHVRFR